MENGGRKIFKIFKIKWKTLKKLLEKKVSSFRGWNEGLALVFTIASNISSTDVCILQLDWTSRLGKTFNSKLVSNFPISFTYFRNSFFVSHMSSSGLRDIPGNNVADKSNRANTVLWKTILLIHEYQLNLLILLYLFPFKNFLNINSLIANKINYFHV